MGDHPPDERGRPLRAGRGRAADGVVQPPRSAHVLRWRRPLWNERREHGPNRAREQRRGPSREPHAGDGLLMPPETRGSLMRAFGLSCALLFLAPALARYAAGEEPGRPVAMSRGAGDTSEIADSTWVDHDRQP